MLQLWLFFEIFLLMMVCSSFAPTGLSLSRDESSKLDNQTATTIIDDTTAADNQAQKMNSDNALTILGKFGYTLLNNRLGEVMDAAEGLKKSLSLFQSVWGLNVTGVLDEPTQALLTAHRCGNADDSLVMQMQGGNRRKRYTFANPWPKMHLTYNISVYSSKSSLTPAQVDQGIADALRVWASYSDLTFSIDRINPDITIQFGTLTHFACQYPFDGRGGILGHAYHPEYGSDLHFDDDEDWRFRQDGGREVSVVALHELGHSLGLEHTNITGAVMYPYYQYTTNLDLQRDDVLGIMAMYCKDLRRGG